MRAQPHPFVCVSSVAAFERQNRAAETETIWPAKPKAGPIWQKKCADPWSRGWKAWLSLVLELKASNK